MNRCSLINYFLLLPSPEPVELSSSRQGTLSVLCAHTPGTNLHAVLRRWKYGDEASRRHGGGGVWLPMRETPAEGKS